MAARKLSISLMHVAGTLASLALCVADAGCSSADSAITADAAPQCPSGVLGCVEIIERTGAAQPAPIVTFGQPFAPGMLAAGEVLAAFDSSGRRLESQVDEPSTNRDGSLRYAVVTVKAPSLPPHGRALLVFRSDPKRAQARPKAPQALRAAPPKQCDMTIELRSYAAQITMVTFGNRNGFEAGIPFREGERIAISLDDGSVERHELVVTKELAGGGYESLTRLAEAFAKAIDGHGRYHAYKIGEGRGYERLWITPRNPPSRPFTTRIEYGGAARVAVSVAQAWEPPRIYRASAQQANAMRARLVESWLAGPLARETSLIAPFTAADGTTHPRLAARFDVRLTADGLVRTDAGVENVWTFVEPRNELYDVSIKEGGQEVFARAALRHNHNARWHQVFWCGRSGPSRSPVEVRHDPRNVIDSLAVPNYDVTRPVSVATIEQDLSDLATSDRGPMGSANLAMDMSMGGGRYDIGLLPHWDVVWLLTQDPRARAVAFANAEATASVPTHYRDRRTGLPVSIDEHPGLTVLYGEPGRPEDTLPEGSNVETEWTPDSGHQPGTAYLEYLLTGDRWWLEELQFWANWNMAKSDPAYRGGAAGLFYPDEVRGQAWSLRTLARAAYVTPDGDPLKPYFTSKLENNIAFYDKRFVDNRDPREAPGLGWLNQPGEEGKTAPWMDDFLSLVLARLVGMGYEEVRPFLDWTARFAVGRWTSEAKGYCWAMGPAYWLTVVDPSGRPYESWGALFRANWPDVRTCPKVLMKDTFPDSPLGYAAIARATLATLASVGEPGALEAWRRLRDATPPLSAAFGEDPTWDIVPRTRARGP